MSGWDQWKIFFGGMVVGAIIDGFFRLGIL